MAENINDQQQANQVATTKDAPQKGQQPPKMKSFNRPEKATIGGIAELENIESNNDTAAAAAATAAAAAAEKTKNEGAAGQQQQQPEVPELTPEQVEKIFGFKGTAAELKAKLDAEAAAGQQQQKQEPTEEEKKKEEILLDQKMLNEFIQVGGNVDQYAVLKSVANGNPSELSLRETMNELKSAGFSDEEAEAIIRERYFQLSDDEIAQYDDENDRAYAKRKKEYGSKKLNSRASQTIERAKKALEALKESITAKDLLGQEEVKFASKVDAHFKEVPRKLSFQLGEVEGKPIAPIDFDITDADIESATSILKDPQKRQQYFFNEDNSLNLANVGQLLVRNAILENAIKASYQESANRQVAEFEKVFPKSAQHIGLGSNNQQHAAGQKGKLVGFGKAQVAVPKK